MDLQSLRKLSTGQKERLHELYTMRVLNLLDTTLDPHDLSLVNLAEDPAAVREAIPECMESLAYLELCLIAEPPSDSNSSVSTEDIKLCAILGLLAAIANEWAGLRHAITRALEVSAGSTANNNLLVRSSARLSSVAAQDREVRRALGLYEGPDQDQSNSARSGGPPQHLIRLQRPATLPRTQRLVCTALQPRRRNARGLASAHRALH